jgi:crotonobetaine/carnitine-CoA ligase
MAAETMIKALTGSDQTTMIDMLRARARLHGDAVFLTWRTEDDVTSWTYAQAWQQVERTASGWLDLGLAEGDRVASFVWNSPQAVWAWLGAAGAGATFIPINRHLRGALLRDQLERVAPRYLVTELEARDVLGQIDSVRPNLVFTDAKVPVGSVSLHTLNRTAPRPIAELDPAAIGFVTFTSGSTGRSKAVRLPNSALIRSASAYASPAVLDLGMGDVLFGWNPLFHLGALIPLAIASGAECALYPSFSASRFWEQVNESGATYVEGFPVMIDYLLSQPPTAAERSHRLRAFFVAGYDEEVWANAFDRFGIPLANIAYDMSETGLVLYNDGASDAPAGSCGRPYPGWEVELEGEDGTHLRGPGAGELVVRPTRPGLLFEGYEDDGEATVDAWRDLWFHTGDWVERDADGYYYLRGRMANRIRRRGENVSEEELVRLLKLHPEVSAAAVVAIPSPKGEHDIKVALVPRAASTPFDLDAYVAWCRSELPRFMMPRFFEVWTELPVLPSEKIDVVRLRKASATMIDIELDARFVFDPAAAPIRDLNSATKGA